MDTLSWAKAKQRREMDPPQVMTTVWGAALGSVKSNSPWPVWTNTHRHAHIKPCSDTVVHQLGPHYHLALKCTIDHWRTKHTHTPGSGAGIGWGSLGRIWTTSLASTGGVSVWACAHIFASEPVCVCVFGYVCGSQKATKTCPCYRYSKCHTRLSDQLQERGNERIWSVTFAPTFKRLHGFVFVCVCFWVQAVFPCQPVRLHGSTSWSVCSMREQSSIHSCVFASLQSVCVRQRRFSVCQGGSK